MCGIAGVHGLEAFESLNNALACTKRMVDAVSHRGPDAEGVWTMKSTWCWAIED